MWPLPDRPEVHRQMRREGVTLQLLWLEYKTAHPTAERLVGLMWYGYPAEVPETPRRPLDEVLSVCE